MTRTKLHWLLTLAIAPIACSDGKPVDLGHGQALLSDYAASWDGYAEAYTFPNGSSDRVRIVLNATGEGTLEVGDAAPDPTPRDPNVPLPGQPGLFHDGFLYPMQAAIVDAGRIRFEIDPGERYAPWCAIQVPFAYESTLYPYTPGQYTCVDVNDKIISLEVQPGTDMCNLSDLVSVDNGTNVISANTVIVSCNRYLPCTLGGVCACTASGCAYNPGASRPNDTYRVDIDGALEGNGASLVGTLAIHPDASNPDVADRVTIRLQRQ